MANGIYRLTLEKENGTTISVCGSEELLRDEFDWWVNFEASEAEKWKEQEDIGSEYINPDAYRPRVIEGFTDDASRASCAIAYRPTDIIGMAFTDR